MNMIFTLTLRNLLSNKKRTLLTLFNHSFVNQYDNLYSLRGMVIG